jgi:WD40 repeat protein
MSGRIFINYRRGDEPGFALALYARLEESFAANQLFMDVEGGIPAGHDFVEVLERQVAQCDVLLVLIGRGWLAVKDENGARRLDNPDDFVRVEIESAMRRGKRVIPVLVNNAEMPRAGELPEPLKPLARRHAVRLTQERFRADVRGLIEVLKAALRETEAAKESASTAAWLPSRDESAGRIKEIKGMPTRRWLFLSLGGAVAFSVVGGTVISRLHLGGDALIRTFDGHLSAVNAVAFSPNGAMALSGSDDRTLKVWDVATGEEFRTFGAHSNSVRSVAFSPDGRTGLSGSADNTVQLWGEQRRILTGHSDEVRSVAFSPDGRSVLSGSSDKTLKLWDVATGMEARTYKGHSSNVISVAFSPDGQTVVSGSADKTLRVWDVATGKDVRIFDGHSDAINSVVFSPDGRSILSGSSDNTVKLWDVATRKLRTFTGHSNAVRSVAFSPDGRTALSGSSDKTLKLWDAPSGKAVRTFTGHSDIVHSVAFSPDGRTALSGSSDKTLKLWDLL